MARKTRSRKELRAEADAVEAAEKKKKAAKKTKKKPAKKAAAKGETKAKKKPTKRKSRAKVAAEVRLKAFWGVFNQSLKRIAVFEYAEKKKAEKKAKDLSGTGKSPHFVQLVKEVIEE
jgi:hypothetical protein